MLNIKHPKELFAWIGFTGTRPETIRNIYTAHAFQNEFLASLEKIQTLINTAQHLSPSSIPQQADFCLTNMLRLCYDCWLYMSNP